MDVLDGLKASYLANHLGQKELESIAAIATVKEFAGGDVVVRQFDQNSDLMLVLDGKVRINSYNGEEVASGGPGSVIGEVSLLDRKPRSATVICNGPCKIAIFRSNEFWNLLKSEPILARTILVNIGQMLCDRLRVANLHLDTIAANKSLH